MSKLKPTAVIRQCMCCILTVQSRTSLRVVTIGTLSVKMRGTTDGVCEHEQDTYHRNLHEFEHDSTHVIYWLGSRV